MKLDLEFTSQAALQAHEWTHVARTPFRCAACAKCFASRDILRAHERRAHDR